MDATKTSFAARASRTSDKWPSCRAPMVGTNPTVVDGDKVRRTDRMESTVRCSTTDAFGRRIALAEDDMVLMSKCEMVA
jgi:hypothetical protein